MTAFVRQTSSGHQDEDVHYRIGRQSVILSAAKDLSPSFTQILRCAQDDTSYLAVSSQKNIPEKAGQDPAFSGMYER